MTDDARPRRSDPVAGLVDIEWPERVTAVVAENQNICHGLKITLAELEAAAPVPATKLPDLTSTSGASTARTCSPGAGHASPPASRWQSEQHRPDREQRPLLVRDRQAQRQPGAQRPLACG